MKTLKASEARNNFSELVSEAQFGGEPVVILRRGKKVAVLMGYDTFLSCQRGNGIVRDAAEIEYGLDKIAAEIDKAVPGWDATTDIRKMRDTRWSS
jgi:prevent-host-death family protein